MKTTHDSSPTDNQTVFDPQFTIADTLNAFADALQFFFENVEATHLPWDLISPVEEAAVGAVGIAFESLLDSIEFITDSETERTMVRLARDFEWLLIEFNSMRRLYEYALQSSDSEELSNEINRGYAALDELHGVCALLCALMQSAAKDSLEDSSRQAVAILTRLKTAASTVEFTRDQLCAMSEIRTRHLAKYFDVNAKRIRRALDELNKRNSRIMNRVRDGVRDHDPLLREPLKTEKNKDYRVLKPDIPTALDFVGDYLQRRP